MKTAQGKSPALRIAAAGLALACLAGCNQSAEARGDDGAQDASTSSTVSSTEASSAVPAADAPTEGSAPAPASTETTLPPESPTTTTAETTPAESSTSESTSSEPATPSSTATPSATTPATPSPTVTTLPAPVVKDLMVGSQGPEVVALQKKLLEHGFWVPNTDGYFGGLTQQAVFAAQKAYGLRRDGIAGPKVAAALRQPVPVTPVSRSGRAVEIDVPRQLLTIVEGGRIVAILNTSTGNGETFYSQGIKYKAITPAGDFTISSSHPWGWKDGPLGRMYKPAFFNGGIAFHGSESIPAYPASHGCARLSVDAANMVWAKGYAANGTAVHVR